MGELPGPLDIFLQFLNWLSYTVEISSIKVYFCSQKLYQKWLQYYMANIGFGLFIDAVSICLQKNTDMQGKMLLT